MPNRPISALPASSTLTGNEVLVTVQDGVTKKETINNLSNFTLNQVPTNKFVTSATLSGNIITLIMSDATSVFVDVTALNVDNDTTITGGSVSGTTLNLNTSGGSIVAIDVSSLKSSLSAINSTWYISYGTNADQVVGSGVMDSTLHSQGPFYFGQELTQGSEFRFNMSNTLQWRLGIWDGVEAATAYNAGLTTTTNWNTVFSFLNGNSSFVDSTNTDVASYQSGTNYVVANNAPLVLRFDNQGHLTLLDLTGGTETIIGKTLNPLSVNSFNLQFGGWTGAVFPNGSITTSDWTIVHDFDNSESGVINGIETDTVLKSNIFISPNEKIMFNLDRMGNGSLFGTNYVGASSGNTNAKFELDNIFSYETNEALDFEIGSTQDWDVNISSSYYFTNGAGVVGYRKNGSNSAQGMFSLRYLSDNTIVIYSEDNNERVATAKINGDGTPIQLYYGAKSNVDYADIPAISKQTIGQVSEPLSTFKPTVADQTVSINEESALNYTIVSSGNIVNQFVEMNAPAWVSLNQSTGVLTGTTPTFTGTSADTITISCKAANVIGGTVDFSITISILDV